MFKGKEVENAIRDAYSCLFPEKKNERRPLRGWIWISWFKASVFAGRTLPHTTLAAVPTCR